MKVLKGVALLIRDVFIQIRHLLVLTLVMLFCTRCYLGHKEFLAFLKDVTLLCKGVFFDALPLLALVSIMLFCSGYYLSHNGEKQSN